MTRKQWTAQDKAELVKEVGEMVSDGAGLTSALVSAANKRGLTMGQVSAAYYKMAYVSGGIPVERSRYKILENPDAFDGDALVLCDAHAPLHHAEFIDGAISDAVRRGIKTCILAGDFLDMNAISAWPDNFAPSPAKISQPLYEDLMNLANELPESARLKLLDKLQESEADGELQSEIKAARQFLASLGANFDKIYCIMGNHEQRLIRKLEKSIGSADISALFFGNDPKFIISPFYWITFTSGGRPWRVTHPINSGKGSSRKLAPKYRANIIMAHNHHLSVSSASDGGFIAIEPGMCADERRMDYVAVRDNAADAHVLGAVIVQDGRAILINDWMA